MGQLLGKFPSTLFTWTIYTDYDIFSSFMHEAMHVIGLYHEFNRIDRDEYVKPVFANIQQGRCSFLMYYLIIVTLNKGAQN